MQRAIKVTLSTNRVVILKEPDVGMQEQALRLVGNKGQGNTALQNYLAGLEMLKLIIAKVDEQDLDYKALDSGLKSMFSVMELAQIQRALDTWLGEATNYDPKIEAVISGP